MKYIIIGGVAGGATTAARIRRVDEISEIILIEKGKYISYANCGLPYYIGGVIEDRENLFLQTPQSFGKRFNVDVRTQSEAIKINAEKKEIEIKHKGETYTESYDKLVLSPGASPFKPNLKGIENEGIFTLRNVNDTDLIKKYVQSKKINNAVVIGAGFIGLEMAENLHHLGAKVSIVEMINQVMAPIDFSMASFVHQHLQQKDVNLYLGETVESFEKTENGLDVIFKNGKKILADIVILSIGVRPEISLAKEAGLTIGEAGGIWVNKFLQTSNENIYALGDAIEYPHPITQKPWLNYLAGPANRQGRIVADNIVFGNTTEYEGSIGTSIAKVFDMTVASTGLPAKRLQQMGIAHQSSTTHSGSHAGYYPDALPMSVKITFDKQNGKLFGAQIVGYDGVDKRLDQIALIIKKQGTIYDLIQLEHAYAPPFSSAKDPIAIAGYVAENIIRENMKVIHWQDIDTANKSEVTILDVRTSDEYLLERIEGAVNIPLDELRDRLGEIPSEKTIYIYCAIGLRGYLAARILMQKGYKNVYNLSGGYKTYQAATEPIKNGKTIKTNVIDTNMEEKNTKVFFKTLKVDACGLQCPGPILKMKKSIESIETGEKIEMISTDAGFSRDAEAWCNMTGNRLISNKSEAGKYTVIIEKVEKKEKPENCETTNSCVEKGKTMIVFSDDLDKALASFVLANGAAATGEKVSMFFTFWGLNVIKKKNKPVVKKDIFGKMFGMMLPSSSLTLKLSKMNMFGMGSLMMRFIMKKKGIESLESLRQQAIENGVEFIACQMSMDVMGIAKEELLDDVTIGGVATYMERADKSNINLFI